jgi:putative glutamine amidotransferase
MKDRPLRIGISSAFMPPDAQRNIFKGKALLYVEESLTHWLQTAGALGYLVPSTPSQAMLKAFLADIDGLVLQGGADVAPPTYGETVQRHDWVGDAIRDAYELELLRGALALDKPVLGICRGAQLINVAFGGTLYQDIETLYERETKKKPQLHRDWHVYDQLFHDITFVPGSKLHTLYGGQAGGRINSVHHQAIKKLGSGLVVEAHAHADGVVEAIRGTGKNYLFGSQWHPEFIPETESHLLPARPILDDFLRAATARR